MLNINNNCVGEQRNRACTYAAMSAVSNQNENTNMLARRRSMHIYLEFTPPRVAHAWIWRDFRHNAKFH